MNISISLPRQSSSRGHPFQALRAFFSTLAARIALADTVARERAMLSRFDDAMLRDIGIDRASAWQESERDYWDVPSDRLDDQDMRRPRP